MAKRRLPQQPYQRKISVQDVRDASTPEGTAQINEEFRRIQIALEEREDKPTPPQLSQAVAKDGGGDASGGRPVAQRPLTVYKNASLVESPTYDLDFRDSTSVRMDVIREVPGLVSIRAEVTQIPPSMRQPLQIRLDTVNIGPADTEIIDYHNPDYELQSEDIQVTFRIEDVGPGERRIRAYIPDLISESGVKPLQIQQDGTNVGANDTDTLDFDNDTPTKPDDYGTRIWFEVSDLGSGDRRIKGWLPNSPTQRPLQIQEDGVDVGDNETELLDFDNPDYELQSEDIQVTFRIEDVGPGERRIRAYIPDLISESGVKPLQIQQDGTNVGANDTDTLDFDNDTPTKPSGHTSRVWFEVSDLGSGDRRIKGWVEGGSSYRWRLSDAYTSPVEIEDNHLVSFVSSDDTEIQVDRYDVLGDQYVRVSLMRGPTVYENNVRVGAERRAYKLDFHGPPVDTESMDRVAWSIQETFWDASGEWRQIEGYVPRATGRPLQIQQRGVDVGDDDTDLLDFDNATATKPAGATSRVWFEVSDLGSGDRRIKGWYAPSDEETPAYTLQLQEDGVNVGDEYTQLIDFANPTVLASAVQVTFDVIDLGGGDRRIRAYVPAYPEEGGGRPLQIQQRGVDVGDDDTDLLDFDNATVTKPVGATSRVWFEVDDLGSGDRRIKGWYAPGDEESPAYTLQLQEDGVNVGDEYTQLIDFDNPTVLASAVQVTFDVIDLGGGDRRVRAYVPAYPEEGGGRPLQIQQRGVDVGDDDTDLLDFDNATVTKPVGATSRVWFEVSDLGSGDRRIKGWYAPGDEETSGYALQLLQDNVGVGDDQTQTIDFDNPTVLASAVQVTFEVIDLGGVNRRVKAYVPEYPADRPLTLRESNIDVITNNVAVINFDNATLTKPVGYTARVWFDVSDAGAGRGDIQGWYAPGEGGGYTWRVETATGSGQVVNDDDLVRFIGLGNIQTRRVGRDVYIEDREPGMGDPGSGSDVQVGFIVFPADGDDYLEDPKPSWRYGSRKYVDIVHGWSLPNMHFYTLDLWDISRQDGSLNHYRSGAGAMNGETFGPVTFRSIPHHSAYDVNTVRVWVTQSRLHPTTMKYWYVLRRAR